MDKLIRASSPLPAFARQRFTFDRGSEFAGSGFWKKGSARDQPRKCVGYETPAEASMAHLQDEA